MDSFTFWSRWLARLGAGLAAGAAIVYVDNYAFAGEVSPAVIVAMLLTATTAAGALWGLRGWAVGFAAWACVPSAHLVKHLLGLPDTLHPNTYRSILYLAAFSLVVAVVGTGCGLLIRRFAENGARRAVAPRSAGKHSAASGGGKSGGAV